MTYRRTPPTDYSEDSQQFQSIRESLFRLRGDRGSDSKYKKKKLHSKLRGIRLKNAKAIGTHTAVEWQNIVSEFDSRCVKCGCKPIGAPSKDHIVPISLGGADVASNLQPLCRECNTEQSGSCFDWASFRRDNGWNA